MAPFSPALRGGEGLGMRGVDTRAVRVGNAPAPLREAGRREPETSVLKHSILNRHLNPIRHDSIAKLTMDSKRIAPP